MEIGNVPRADTAMLCDPLIAEEAINLIVRNFALENGMTIHHIGLIGSRGRGLYTPESDYDFAFVYSVNGKTARKIKTDVRFEIKSERLGDKKIEFVGTELTKYMREISSGSIYQLEWLASTPLMGPLARYVMDIRDPVFDRSSALNVLNHVRGLVRSVVEIPGRAMRRDQLKQYALARHYLVVLTEFSDTYHATAAADIFTSIRNASNPDLAKGVILANWDIFEKISTAMRIRDFSAETSGAILEDIDKSLQAKTATTLGDGAKDAEAEQMALASFPYEPWGQNENFDIRGGCTEFMLKLEQYPYL